MGVALTLDRKVTGDERQSLQREIAVMNLLACHHTLPFKEL